MFKTLAKVLFVPLLFHLFAFAQSTEDFISILVPLELKTDANAVVRYDNQIVEIKAYNKMYVTTKRIVTIFNKYGDRHQNAYEFYDSNTKIKELEVHIYDALGKEIKKVKSKDFTDESAVSGGTLYSDNRLKYLSYTPVKYPYTIEYYSEVEYRSTAFVPRWRPVDAYLLAVQYSEYKLINDSGIKINFKDQNFDNYNIEKRDATHFIIENSKGIKPEQYSPEIRTITPSFKVALTKFDMEGVEGINNNWEDFGLWMYDRLLTDTDKLPQSAIDKVQSLTSGVTDNIEKAKLVYQFMQDKTRYISVQVGIGGWKPMLADEVDRLGYADCKGLTNYTKALLEAVGVPSYYTVVWGDRSLKSIDKEFSATEGNHAILCVPNKDENIFLECTSQTNPFGFTAGFTDDRDVLLVKPEGGEIVHTKIYEADDSIQKTTAIISLDNTGGFNADVNIETTGFQYSLHEGIENKTNRDQQLHYKEYWDNINGIAINNITIVNDKASIIYKEALKLSSTNYASKSGNRLIFQVNMFNKVTNIPPRYSERKLEFKIDRAFKDVDEFIIQIPQGLKVEAMSEGKELNTKFGSYKFKLEDLGGNKIKYTRTYILNKGNYQKDDYKSFRDFTKQIVKADKSKIVLVSI